MIPLLASGAASLANVLVNRAAGSSASQGGNLHLDAKSFERALNKASGNKQTMSPAEQQSAALSHQLMKKPEIEAAISAQPANTVSGVAVQADGSVGLQTSRGIIPVQLAADSRQLAQALYNASMVQEASAAQSPSLSLAKTDTALILPLQGGALR